MIRILLITLVLAIYIYRQCNFIPRCILSQTLYFIRTSKFMQWQPLCLILYFYYLALILNSCHKIKSFYISITGIGFEYDFLQGWPKKNAFFF